MQPNAVLSSSPSIVYPESDGKPLAENTKQLRWILTLYGNLAAMFRDRNEVFIAGDNLWYPVEGRPDICNAPDVYLVFGRPKGDRSSYKQWEESNIPLTVVFEVLSPGNTMLEMADKLDFYDEYGVEEYYIYDPDNNHLMVYNRKGSTLGRVRPLAGYVSPRLGIRFDLSGIELTVYRPDGQKFLTFEELEDEKNKLKEQLEDLKREAHQTRQIKQQWSRLLELSKIARHGHATAEELRELEQLEQTSG